MLYWWVADAVVVVHFAFLVFLATGSLLAWRWRRLIWAHLPCVAWGLLSIRVGLDCPLTPLEKHFRALAGEHGYAGGFVDHYIEGVVYPERFTPALRLLIVVAVVAGYSGLVLRSRRPDPSGMRRPARATRSAPHGCGPRASGHDALPAWTRAGSVSRLQQEGKPGETAVHAIVDCRTALTAPLLGACGGGDASSTSTATDARTATTAGATATTSGRSGGSAPKPCLNDADVSGPVGFAVTLLRDTVQSTPTAALRTFQPTDRSVGTGVEFTIAVGAASAADPVVKGRR